jgi:DNA-binding response OmpR family regulator
VHDPVVSAKQGIGVNMSLLYIAQTPDASLVATLVEAGHGVQSIAPTSAEQALTGSDHGFILLALEHLQPDLLAMSVKHRRHAAVMVLLGNSDRQARIAALRAGADVCLAQPVSAVELMARMQALSREHPVIPAPPPARLWLSPSRLMLGRGKRQQPLTVSEHRLLAVLARNPGAVSRQSIETQLWGASAESRAALIERHVCNLRRKLAELDSPDALQTLRGFGYSLREAVVMRTD